MYHFPMVKNSTVFCTYFDKYYLLKGLALYASLMRHNPEACLWILPMDIYTENILKELNLPNVSLISLSEFEDKELLQIKKTRNPVEYYWTCTPSLPLYLLNNVRNLEKVVYVDSDMMFFSEASPVLWELGEKSIFIVEHKFVSDQKHRVNTSGRFNVGILAFKRDSEGLSCLKRWREQCIDWCYFKEEEGKMGDQVYLNEWPKLYKNLVISKSLGINVAPWNEFQYDITNDGKDIYINSVKLICYHFHQFKIVDREHFILSRGYELSSAAKQNIYTPYIQEIKKRIGSVTKIDPDFHYFEGSLWEYYTDIFHKYVLRPIKRLIK